MSSPGTDVSKDATCPLQPEEERKTREGGRDRMLYRPENTSPVELAWSKYMYSVHALCGLGGHPSCEYNQNTHNHYGVVASII